jgi:hypothetical protein
MSARGVVGSLVCGLMGCGDVTGTGPAPVASSRQAIVGGTPDLTHESVGFVENSPVDAPHTVCTGTLVSKRTVLTSAHCMDPGVVRVSFDVGDPPVRIPIAVTSSVRHPQYEPIQHLYDLMLLELAEDAPVQPAVLLREMVDGSFIGPAFTWVGYGVTDFQLQNTGTRMTVQYPITLVGPANVYLPTLLGDNYPKVDVSQFYAESFSKHTCVGDSGGPAFIVRNGVERQAGALATGDAHCDAYNVTVKTDAVTMGWIQSTLNGFEPGNPCRADGMCNSICVSTSPAPHGTMDDPDCADQHCGADGICARSCVPPDPDCPHAAVPDAGAGAGGGTGGGGGNAAGGGTNQSHSPAQSGDAACGGAATPCEASQVCAGRTAATARCTDACRTPADCTGGSTCAVSFDGITKYCTLLAQTKPQPGADPENGAGGACSSVGGLLPLLAALVLRRRRTHVGGRSP